MFSEEGAHVLRSERVSTPLPWRTARGKSTGPAHSKCSHALRTVRNTHAGCLPRGHIYTAK